MRYGLERGGQRRRRRRQAKWVGAVGVATVTLLSLASTAQAGSVHPGSPAAVQVEAGALGVNTAAWDGAYTGTSAATINQELKAAHLGLLRYPGGSWADEYDWSTNTDTSNCDGGPVTPTCTSADSLDFDTFSSQARAADAASFVTVNYGSGTPAEAAAWVAHARQTKGDAVAYWEVGNENYGCWETNDYLAQYPTYVQGYVPNGSVCPTTSVMADSYSTNAMPFLLAMKNADHSAQLGVPWAFTTSEATGSGVTDASTWNTTVLGRDGADVGFVDAHWYPFSSVAGLTPQQIVDSVQRIPAAAASIRTTLRHYDPKAGVVVGETNISNQETTLDFQPVSALFAAATSLEWLSQGVHSVDWWDMNNYGSPTGGDYGLFSSGSPETQPADAPLPPYYGEELASMLTTPHSQLQPLSTGSSIIGLQSVHKDQRRVLLINPTSDPVNVPAGWSHGAALSESTYSAATATTATPIVHSTIRASGSTNLPAQSINVVSGGRSS